MLHVSNKKFLMKNYSFPKLKVAEILRDFRWAITMCMVIFASGLSAQANHTRQEPLKAQLAQAPQAKKLLEISQIPQATCNKAVYLTFDTGHMGIAPLVAKILQQQQVRATFFLANEAALTGGSSLDEVWAPWWRARVAEGHMFGSHTYDHVYWQADLVEGGFKVKPSAGPKKGQTQTFTTDQYCESLEQVAQRYNKMTGAKLSPIFRAAGGKTSAALIKAAQQCGYTHVGWSPNGFLGDELPSNRYPNSKLLEQALKNIKPGDILLAHLGIWSRQDPWAPAVLEPLIVGLKERGFCFKTINQHPQFKQIFKPTS